MSNFYGHDIIFVVTNKTLLWLKPSLPKDALSKTLRISVCCLATICRIAHMK